MKATATAFGRNVAVSANTTAIEGVRLNSGASAQASANVQVIVTKDDVYTFPGDSDLVYLNVDVKASGTVDGNITASAMDGASARSAATISFEIKVNGVSYSDQAYHYASTNPDQPELHHGLRTDGTPLGILVPTHLGDYVTFSLSAGATADSFSEYPSTTATATADFAHTLTWLGVTAVTDQYGNPLSKDAFHLIDVDDGADWATLIPEPGTAMALVGVATLFLRRPSARA